MTEPKIPAYAADLLRQAMNLNPGLHLVSIIHDEWCDLLAGKGPCNCNPEMQQPVNYRDHERRN